MIKEWLHWINYAVSALIAVLLVIILTWRFAGSTEIPIPELPASSTKLPTSPFQQSQKDYDAIGKSVIQLKFAPMTLQLPDLRQVLSYYGKNNRPDADSLNTALHFGLTGTKISTSVLPNTKTFLIYDKSQTPPRYEFSPDNKPTALWFEAIPKGNQVLLKVRMNDEKGEIVTQPSSNAEFTLAEKPLIRADATSWTIGKQRVDGTLLARQRARWYGVDKFLEKHGGKEYQHTVGKQRVDFGEGAELYSVFIGEGDVLIWNHDRWQVAVPGEETLKKPLLVVKKVDDRLMTFELWDADGKTKVTLNLLKSSDPPLAANILQSFKYVAARTRSQLTFEVNQERMTLSPLDWLLQTGKGWKKLITAEDIDNYVDRKETGFLFVFESVEKRDDRQVLVGTLFNKSRSDYLQLDLAMEVGAPLAPVASAAPATGTKLTPRPPSQAQFHNQKMNGKQEIKQDEEDVDDEDEEDDDEDDHDE